MFDVYSISDQRSSAVFPLPPTTHTRAPSALPTYLNVPSFSRRSPSIIPCLPVTRQSLHLCPINRCARNTRFQNSRVFLFLSAILPFPFKPFHHSIIATFANLSFPHSHLICPSSPKSFSQSSIQPFPHPTYAPRLPYSQVCHHLSQGLTMSESPNILVAFIHAPLQPVTSLLYGCTTLSPDNRTTNYSHTSILPCHLFDNL